ncbi:hypothetical protein SAPIO_CDS8733 [Scedosporium apiospermum]|uniref:FAD-binding PCMH-type domain-containing protein n=1 Tax=Pseudallescheria apiosperma TaxID=563466 RepID=A0A084FYU5_PSEDA|nr:uncharacterized protein SAPIO_CDS8733 [Scedosporium apiospermum]KEZ40257.1 hypothetical protein SAPIO_CDS8733 [Scedosporium apiospermum]
MVKFYEDRALQEKHDSTYQTLPKPVRVLPPGLDEAAFDRVLIEFLAIVGKENVASGDEVINFKDPYPLDNEAHQPSAGVCPATLEEVQAILDVCNRYVVPVWTCSQGKNFGYGGPAPRVDGSVVLSLHRMNRIIEVNEKHAYIVVEPGVTFFQMYEYLREHRSRLWISAPALGWGSIVGNTLDRGHGYLPSGDRQHFIASMEIVLANGEVMRTGQWGLKDGPATHLCSNQFGPQIHGLFLQSNLGVVTKLALHLDIAPQAMISVVVSCPEVSQIEGLIDSYEELYRERILQGHPSIHNVNHFATRFSRKYEQQTDAGPLSKTSLEKLAAKFGTGYWRSNFDLYGTKAMVNLRWERVQEVLSNNIPGCKVEHTFWEGENGGPVDQTKIGTVGAGVPAMFAAALADYNLPADGTGAGAHTDITLLLPSNGKIVHDWFVRMRKIMEDAGADPFIGCHVWDRHVLFVQEYVYDKTSASARARGREIMTAIVDEAKRSGYSTYRSHLMHMGKSPSFEAIEASIDPRGILSPGKNGIWPSKLSENFGRLKI